jgi:hypothetical protein
MNPDNRRGNNDRTAKKIATMRIAGIVVATSLLLSGLSVIGNYNSVLAQQNITEGGARPTGVGGTTDNTTQQQQRVVLHKVEMLLLLLVQREEINQR